MNVLTVNDLHLDFGSGATTNPILQWVSTYLKRAEVVALIRGEEVKISREGDTSVRAPRKRVDPGACWREMPQENLWLF